MRQITIDLDKVEELLKAHDFKYFSEQNLIRSIIMRSQVLSDQGLEDILSVESINSQFNIAFRQIDKAYMILREVEDRIKILEDKK